jgi:hypothetical protein
MVVALLIETKQSRKSLFIEQWSSSVNGSTSQPSAHPIASRNSFVSSDSSRMLGGAAKMGEAMNPRSVMKISTQVVRFT